MQHKQSFVFLRVFFLLFLCESFFPAFALDSDSKLRKGDSPPSTGRNLSLPSASQESFAKQPPTTDQQFTAIFSKLAGLEQTVAALQNQVNAQAQLIAQLKQVVSVNSSGTVTIQAPGAVKILAGGNVQVSGSSIDMKAAMTGIHGVLKADVMMTTNVIAQTYTPGAGNIW